MYEPKPNDMRLPPSFLLESFADLSSFLSSRIDYGVSASKIFAILLNKRFSVRTETYKQKV